jgi:3-deoxy-D-manno-octulosonate 8-phosphate phosphatase (KDO 8-P phosphatase)
MPDETPHSLIAPDVVLRARKVKLFLMDVDGTLTDGGICLISSLRSDQKDVSCVTEMKVFNAQDGQGLSLAHSMGIVTGFITGRRSPAVEQRAKELNVRFVCLGQASKTRAYEECMTSAGVTEEEVAYLGDDLRISHWPGARVSASAWPMARWNSSRHATTPLSGAGGGERHEKSSN